MKHEYNSHEFRSSKELVDFLNKLSQKHTRSKYENKFGSSEFHYHYQIQGIFSTNEKFILILEEEYDD